MPQKEIVKNGVKKLVITVTVQCKDHPSGRIQLKRIYDDVLIGSNKAAILERELSREAEREKAQRENDGSTWKVLLSLYEVYSHAELEKGHWMQSRQTYDESIRALHNWTADWYQETASKIAASDVTRLFHSMKDKGCSDSHLAKLRADIRKVFDFGILYGHVRGIKESPTAFVSVKSRKRMRKEILQAEEIIKLLSYAHQYEPKWHFIWAFAVYTGARNGELYALKWTDINFTDRMITIQRSYNKKYRVEKSTKTDDWRHVSICEPLWEIVLELKRNHDHDVGRGECAYPGYVLPRPGAWQQGSQALILRRFCEEIGITQICFHTLRACFATELLKRGVPVPSVMRVGGWKSLKTMMHYVRLAGMGDKGITDPLEFRTAIAIESNRTLMNAVGESLSVPKEQIAKVIPLNTRKLPRA